MKIQEACKIMELKEPLTKEAVKKQYYRLALKYHPDKNPNISDNEFQTMNEAYIFINNNYVFDNEKSKNIFSYISPELYNILINKCTNALNTALSKMNSDTFINLYNIIKDSNLDEHISPELLNLLEHYHDLNKKKGDIERHILRPTLKDLFEHNIFKYCSINDGNNYYVPLWHHEVHFTTAQKKKIIIECNPAISDEYYIDEFNNLHIHHNEHFSDIFNKSQLNICLYDKKNIHIDIKNLFIRKYQVHIIKNIGFSQIDTNDIYNISNKANIIIHLHLF